MRILKFTLSGELACFKKATTFDVSTEFILTYEIIPITVLKGIIGAILGYDGLSKAFRMQTKPEYMVKLRDVGIGIKPIKLGSKFSQQFTNTTGFANQNENKQGTTNIIKQELLNDIEYDIYITDEFDDFEVLYKSLLNNRVVYPIVLGRKGFNATFSKVELIDFEILTHFEGKLDSIYYTDKAIPKTAKFFSTESTTYKYLVDLPFDYDDLMLYKFKKISYADENITYSDEVIVEEAIAILR